jgi:hypothetical protein
MNSTAKTPQDLESSTHKRTSLRCTVFDPPQRGIVTGNQVSGLLQQFGRLRTAEIQALIAGLKYRVESSLSQGRVLGVALPLGIDWGEG